MSAARDALLDLAGKLTEDEAAAVLTVARAVAGSGRRARARLREWEDRADVRAARKALAEPGSIPLATLKAELGL